MGDLGIFDDDAGVVDGFATAGDEEVGGDTELVGFRGSLGLELESRHLVGEEVGVSHYRCWRRCC